MQIGVDSFGAVISEPATGLTLSPVQRMANLLEEIELADQVGLDVFGVGEHHRSEFVDSAPVVILGAAAARTKKYSPDKRRNRSQRGGSRPHLSGIRHAGPDLPWACRDRLQDEVRQSKSLRSSVSIWTTTTRSSQRSWIFCSRFARTRILAGLASTEHPLPVRRSTRVRCKIRCPFGSVSGELPNHSFVPWSSAASRQR
jgi:hypothetical protein